MKSGGKDGAYAGRPVPYRPARLYPSGYYADLVLCRSGEELDGGSRKYSI